AALYTVAVVTFHAGEHASAKRKAEALLDACNDPKDAIIKQAANHLIAEIARGAGDSETAVTLASEALALATGPPEEVAFTKQAVARALSDNGQTEEALAHAIEAYELMRDAGLPAIALADVLFQIVSYSSVLGRSSEASEALKALSLLESNSHDPAKANEGFAETKEKAPKLAEMNMALREQIVTITTGDWDKPASQRPEPPSLEQANAKVMKSLLSLWDGIPNAYPGSAAMCYDFWGRGNFARLLRNAQTIRSAFNITLEVRTLDGLKQAVRLWSLYADMLMLIWKGPTQDGKLLDVLPGVPEVFGEPGGYGYILGSPVKDDSGRDAWLVMAHASLLPVEVISFLMNEARPLLAAGRLIVVPATGIGCVHPGHGPLEQLVTESANAIAGLRSSDKSNEVPIGMMPYSPDAPFELLADIIEAQQPQLRKLRRLLIRRTRELAPNEAGIIANKELALEIDDALRDLADEQNATARKRGVASAQEPLNGGFCRFHRNGSRLLPGPAASPSPFAPLLTLQNFGYKWGISSPGSQPEGRYEPGKESVVGTWLVLPTDRWSMLAVRKTSDE
ncbi:MAG: tetratricopeptide repeat protein, partial [Terriglobia bacterium]